MALRVPPPTAAFLDPDPLATHVIPVPAVDRRWGKQEGVFLPVVRRAFTDDVARVADRFRRGQDFEVTEGKITKRVEIVHLPIHPEECVLGAVTKGRRPDNQPRGIAPHSIDAISCARRAAERSQVSKSVTQLCFGPSNGQEQE